MMHAVQEWCPKPLKIRQNFEGFAVDYCWLGVQVRSAKTPIWMSNREVSFESCKTPKTLQLNNRLLNKIESSPGPQSEAYTAHSNQQSTW